MKISLNWLKEYIPLHLEHHDLAHRLTMIGLEVEAITANPKSIQGIMVGEIVNVKNHPNATKLKICTVNIGRESLGSDAERNLGTR